MGVVNVTPRPLYPKKDPYPLYRRLVVSQGSSGRVRKISPTQGFNPRTVQPVASRYTDWAIPAPRQNHISSNLYACYTISFPSLTKLCVLHNVVFFSSKNIHALLKDFVKICMSNSGSRRFRRCRTVITGLLVTITSTSCNFLHLIIRECFWVDIRHNWRNFIPCLVRLHVKHETTSVEGVMMLYKVVQIWPELIFFVTIIAHHSSNSQTGLNRF